MKCMFRKIHQIQRIKKYGATNTWTKLDEQKLKIGSVKHTKATLFQICKRGWKYIENKWGME